MLILTLFLTLSSLAAWAAAVTLPALALGRLLATALVRMIKGS